MALIKTREVMAAVMTHLDGGATTNYLSKGPKNPAAADKFVIIHPSPGAYHGPLGDYTTDCVVKFQTTSVGRTAEQALWVHDTCNQRLHRAELAVASGVVTHPIRQVAGSAQPVTRDEEINPPMFYVTCQWVAHAHPTD